MTSPRTPVPVAVLMGGRSGEHEVSRASGRAVLRHLPRDRYAPIAVLIDRQGRWHVPAPESALASVDDPAAPGLPLPEGLRALLDLDPAVVFIAMHGPEGEDGRLQSLFELVGLPFVGSGSGASSLAMNKPVTKAIYRSAGIPVAADRLLDRARFEADPEAVVADIQATFSPPYVLKTPRLGSSVGLDILEDAERLPATLARLFALDDHVLVEAFVAGRELTCGVLQLATWNAPRPLPVLEISPVSSHFFDFHAKYTPGAAREVCPAPIPEAVRDAVWRLALRAHEALGCRAVSRTDFIWSPEADTLVALETNTIPGLTETSLLPQQAAAAGISFPALVSGLVDAALAARKGPVALAPGPPAA